MAKITLTDVEDEVLKAIKLRAETTGRSLEEVAREILKLGLLADIPDRVAVADRIRAMTPRPLDEDSTHIIRRLRDAS
jgi:plasmid stability protein